jgi:hypothetical protein
MKFTLEINCDNAAFEDADGNDCAYPEIARILRELSDKYDEGRYIGPVVKLRDDNGNTVGEARLTGKRA